MPSSSRSFLLTASAFYSEHAVESHYQESDVCRALVWIAYHQGDCLLTSATRLWLEILTTKKIVCAIIHALRGSFHSFSGVFPQKGCQPSPPVCEIVPSWEESV